ncbi:MAG: endolytic transglycosylase MltG [Oscillospiraceae bacterium]|jgi:UPF0755 protein
MSPSFDDRDFDINRPADDLDLDEFRRLAESNEPVEKSEAENFDFTRLTQKKPAVENASERRQTVPRPVKKPEGSKKEVSRPAKMPKPREDKKPERDIRTEKTVELGSRRRTGCLGALLFFAFIVGISTLLAVVGWMAATDVLALGKDYETAVIEIEETDGLPDVARKLSEKGIIEYPWLFRLFGRIADAEEKIQPGSFELNTTMDYRAIITSMGSHSPTRLTVKITIPEGFTLKETLKKLADNGVASYDKLLDTAANYDFEYSFLSELPLGDENRLEGYLFPDTYEFYIEENTVTAINKLLSNFNSKFGTEMRERAEEMGYSIHDIVTIASLIEEEAANDSERATVASVIYNRLSSDSFPYLQIDATVQYALPERKEELSLDDLQIDSPYNTYKYPGLPAGPIANPGWASLNAALYPASTDYYFYALGADGTHHFSRTKDEHDAFVAQMNG